MHANWRSERWLPQLRLWGPRPKPVIAPGSGEPRKIGLALGGGFARGIAHVGVLRVLERNHIPIHCVAGVSAGAIVAAAFASGATAEEIGKVGCSMRFADVARFSLCRLGFVDSVRMARFLRKLLKSFRFEEMRIPLGVVATDIATGEPVMFRTEGMSSCRFAPVALIQVSSSQYRMNPVSW